jgi:hypothetical protein
MLRRPFLWTVDTFILQRGTENQAHCLARDHLVGCRDLFQHHLVGMDWFPVFQHLPDATMHAVLAGLTATALAGEVAYTTSAGVAHRTPLVDVLLQLFTHGQYHRGKANAALRAIGAEAAGVDFISWAREGEPSARPPAPSR